MMLSVADVSANEQLKIEFELGRKFLYSAEFRDSVLRYYNTGNGKNEVIERIDNILSETLKEFGLNNIFVVEEIHVHKNPLEKHDSQVTLNFDVGAISVITLMLYGLLIRIKLSLTSMF